MKNVSSSNSHEGLVPKLRFPEFQEEWKYVKLSDITERVTRKNSKNETNLPLTISSKDGLVDQITYFSKQVSSKDMSGYYLLKNGEFAYNKSYSVGYDFGSIKRLDRYPMGALSTLYICFALKKYNSDFMKVYFDSLKWYREIYMIASEGARNHGLLNVPTEDFFNTRHILPVDTAEQKKIATFLLLLDQRLEKQRQLVENLKSYKRGALKKIFSKIDKKVPLYKLVRYSSSSKTLSSISKLEDGEYPVYDANGIDKKINSYDFDTEYIAIIKDGSGVGRLQLCQRQSSIIGTLGAMLSIDLPIEYIYSYLQLVDFTPYVTGMAIPHIYFKDYGNIQVPITNDKTLNNIVSISKNLDKKIQIAENQLSDLITMKSSLLNKMFI